MKKHLKKLIIIDGNAIIHRSFHALPPTMVTKTGQVTNAVYGFALFLLKAIEEFKPEYIVLTLDQKGPTFRHEAYKEYKATRVKAPDELYVQIPVVRSLAEAFDIPIFSLSGYEADDLIGTIAHQVDSKVEKYIMTGDLDTLQLVNDHTKVYTMSRGISDSLLYDAQQVKERFSGLGPNQMIDYKALRGDVSDNIPGVKGIGEKTAIELLTEFKTLDGLYKAVDKNDKKIRPRVLELLKEHKEESYLSRDLATININAPIKFSLADAEIKKLDRDKIIKLFNELEFKSLMPRLSHLDDYLDKSIAPKKTTDSTGAEMFSLSPKFKRDLDQFNYYLIDTPEKFQDFKKKLNAEKIFTLDTETTSLDPLTTKLLGASFSWKQGEAYFVIADLVSGLKDILANENIKKCGHNIKFDARVLKNQGLEVNGIYFDTMIASHLLNPASRQHSLDAVTLAELSFEKINHEDLLGSGKNKLEFASAPLDRLYVYASEDADFTNRLVEVLEPKLKEEKSKKIFEEIEMPLVPVLADMEDNGILINQDLLAKMDKELSAEIKKLEKKIYDLAGIEFNVSSPKQLKEILFERLKIEVKGIKKTKTGISTAADELEKLKDAHPIIPLIQNYRELTKLFSTYVSALPELINKKTGRLHTSFNQTITATGRLSSTEPNLQNIPTRTELGKTIREAFVAAPGYELASLDYSQIELRLAAHMAHDEKMIAAFTAGKDIHTATAAEINKVKLEDVTSAMRRAAKAINFGVLYGQGPRGLSETAGISFDEAKKFIADYFAAFDHIKAFIETTLENARKNGYVETLLGRKRYLPEINSSVIMIQKAAERMAVNAPLQGTAADIIKMAMIKIYDLIKDQDDIKMLLQVHDELIFEIKKDKVDYYTKKIKTIMENVIKLDVPLIADIGVGKNWGELK